MLGHATPDDRSGEDLIECLKDDQTILEILEQVVHTWLDAKRIEPECEHTRFVLAFSVKVVHNPVVFLFLLVERLEPGVCVEEVGNEGEVKAWVSREKRRRG